MPSITSSGRKAEIRENGRKNAVQKAEQERAAPQATSETTEGKIRTKKIQRAGGKESAKRTVKTSPCSVKISPSSRTGTQAQRTLKQKQRAEKAAKAAKQAAVQPAKAAKNTQKAAKATIKGTVTVVKAETGNEGGKKFWSWYGFNSRVSWCACFTSWCGEQCGLIQSGAMPEFSLCTDGVKWFNDRNFKRLSEKYPQA